MKPKSYAKLAGLSALLLVAMPTTTVKATPYPWIIYPGLTIDISTAPLTTGWGVRAVTDEEFFQAWYTYLWSVNIPNNTAGFPQLPAGVFPPGYGPTGAIFDDSTPAPSAIDTDPDAGDIGSADSFDWSNWSLIPRTQVDY